MLWHCWLGDRKRHLAGKNLASASLKLVLNFGYLAQSGMICGKLVVVLAVVDSHSCGRSSSHSSGGGSSSSGSGSSSSSRA